MVWKRKIIWSIIILIAVSISALPVYAAMENTATDISRAGIGAKPMAMGKAYTALADDANAVLMNPAGMAYFTTPKLMNINSEMQHDVRYSTFALAWPTPVGTFGLGYVDVGVDNIYLAEWVAGEPVIVDKATYANSVLFLSYAAQVNRQLAWGMSLKSFQQRFANLGIDDANAQGANMDLGFLYRLDSRWSFGLMYQNAITAPTLVWGNGGKEIIESHVKAGIAYQYKEPPRGFGINRITYTFDADMPVVNPYQATTYHLGSELWFADVFALRLGLGTREAYVSGRMQSLIEPALGIGLNLWGVQVDYTYAPGVLDLSDQGEKYFLSLAYQLPEEDYTTDEDLTKETKEAGEVAEVILIREIAQAGWGSTIVKSEILKKNVVTLQDVMGDDFDPKNTFFVDRSGQKLTRWKLYPGENLLAYKKGGQEYVVKFLIIRDYADVYQNTPGYAAIQSLTMVGVINGYRGNRSFFEPYAKVDIGELDLAMRRLENGHRDLTEKPQIDNKAITRKEAVRMIAGKFGGSFEEYLKVFPHQAGEDIRGGLDGGFLHRYEMAQLLSRTNKAKDKFNKLAQEYNVSLGEIYVTSAYED